MVGGDFIDVELGALHNAEVVAKRGHGNERWADGATRFAIEDWLGAGAIISRLGGSMGALAVSASRTFETFEKRLDELLYVSPSGQELIDAGYPDDIFIASELDADTAVPLLTGNAFKLAVP